MNKAAAIVGKPAQLVKLSCPGIRGMGSVPSYIRGERIKGREKLSPIVWSRGFKGPKTNLFLIEF